MLFLSHAWLWSGLTPLLHSEITLNCAWRMLGIKLWSNGLRQSLSLLNYHSSSNNLHSATLCDLYTSVMGQHLGAPDKCRLSGLFHSVRSELRFSNLSAYWNQLENFEISHFLSFSSCLGLILNLDKCTRSISESGYFQVCSGNSTVRTTILDDSRCWRWSFGPSRPSADW